MKNCTHKTPEDMLTGTLHTTSSSGNLKVVRYTNAKNVDVQFVGYSHILTVQAGNVRLGKVKNVMLPVLYNKGYIGVGIYSAKKNKKAYQTWKDVLTRCYCPKYRKKQPTYTNCTMSSAWLNFQNFAEWFYEESNYEDGLYLDKDILVQGNKEYSSGFCIFVTQEVNNVLTLRGNDRGMLMLGVTFHKPTGKFRARCGVGGSIRKSLGLFSNEKDAHEAYKTEKYKQIKKLALVQQDARVAKGLLSFVIPSY